MKKWVYHLISKMLVILIIMNMMNYLVSAEEDTYSKDFTIGNVLSDYQGLDGNKSGTDPELATPLATVPEAPTEVTATAGNGQVIITYTAPTNDGGSPITGYKVEVYDGIDFVETVDVAFIKTTVAISDLINGKEYSFYVVATNAIGDSTPSNILTVTPSSSPLPAPIATVTKAPTAVKATAGDGQVIITYKVPANDGGSDITGYKVQVYDGIDFVKTVDVAPTETTATITGLTNGKEYSFNIVATNEVGDSTPSNILTATPVAPVPPTTVSGAPTAVTATAGNGQVTITYTGPANDGGSPITGYKIQVYDGMDSVKTVDVASIETTATITGLTNGKEYSFCVVATNSVGDSTPSNILTATPVAPKTPTTPPKQTKPTPTVPRAQTLVTATAGDGEVTITYNLPASDGGSPITGYKINVNDGIDFVKTVDVAPTETTVTITGLINGREYSFYVVATNAVGDSTPSNILTATPVAPTPPIMPETPTTQTTTGTAKVLDKKTGHLIHSIKITVTTEADSTKTVSMDANDVVLLKQPNGTFTQLTDISKLGFTSDDNIKITISSNSEIKIGFLEQGTAEVTYDLGNGEKIVIGNIKVTVSDNADVAVVIELIDPYGTLTDAVSGEVIEGAKVTLYYADSKRNKDAGKIPGTEVKLPLIPGFKPNDNLNPQASDVNGTYGYMVFPNTDYYIIAEKDGYETYTSPTISVEKEIVKFDIKMNKKVSGNLTENKQTTKLPQAGSFVDFTVLMGIGIALVLLGLGLKIKRNSVKKSS